MQPIARMISKKSVNKMWKGVIAALPVIPFIKPKKSVGVLTYVLGGIGLSLVGGIAALMYFSPRTRYRAMDAAKDAYGKMNAKLGHLKGGERVQPNGLVGTGYQSTGL
jgi:hypothetical protein